eukprot:s980_g21.t1
MILRRLVDASPVSIEPDRRHSIGSDHAIVHAEVFSSGHRRLRWGNDSRARWVVGELPSCIIVDDEDVANLARECTRPRRTCAFTDDQATRDAISVAKCSKSPTDWKHVHKLRRKARDVWKKTRLQQIVQGSWEDFRQLQNEKKRKRGWWGNMLAEKSSATLTAEVQQHLESKMVDPKMSAWDARLEELITSVRTEDEFVDFSILELREELQGMKCKSAVGPDGIGVHLLRTMASHDDLGPQLLDLINYIVRTQAVPSSWNVSFLALLAKVEQPAGPGDLRPICVSSAFNKLVNRLVCSRTLPLLRRGSRVSACGKGRQAADLIGAISRVRDVVHEWKSPALICKLDVAGAFDRVDRQKVAEPLIQRLTSCHVSRELRYLLTQLRTHELVGKVPGGQCISFSPNNGIKQGAPESAEIFGLVIDAMLSELTASRHWKKFGESLPGLDVEIMFYQDDIFILDKELGMLGRRIRVIDKCLQRAGLRLATNKTKIIASAAYMGHRSVKIGDDVFQIAPLSESVKVLGVSFSFGETPSQQAQELLSRTRASAAAHRDVLTAKGAWVKKLYMIKMLVESRFSWTAGALHWSAEDLRCANLLQLHVLRTAFGLCRKRDESWVDWNSRTMRFLRAWLVSHGYPRWSEKILGLQFSLHGHWARKVNRNIPPCLSMHNMALLLWRVTLVVWFETSGGTSDDEWESSWRTGQNFGSWQTWDETWDEPTPSSWPSSSSWQTPSSSSTQPVLPACSSSASSWGHAEYVAWMSAAWDEEITAAAQLRIWQEEIEEEESARLASVPSPEDLPLPAALVALDVQPGDRGANQPDWLEAVMDKRVLRGGRRLGCFPVGFGGDGAPPPPGGSTPSSSSASSSSCSAPTLSSCLPGSSGPSSSSSRNAPSITPSSATTPSSSQDSVTSLDNVDWEEGVTQRWGVFRPGRDRWHNPDGTVKRNTLPSVPEERPGENIEPFEVVDVGQREEETTVKAVTFYGDRFEVRANRGNLPSMGDEVSTTAGEDETSEEHELEGEPDNATSSSDAACTPPTLGFWHHGVWVDRPRTMEEQRRHVGGRGMRRTLKREARMASYFKGDWKPKWLCDYIAQKAERERASSSADPVLEITEPPAECPPAAHPSDTDDGEPTNQNQWSHLGWWTQAEWDSWWKWNGMDDFRNKNFGNLVRDEYLVLHVLAFVLPGSVHWPDNLSWDEFLRLLTFIFLSLDAVPNVCERLALGLWLHWGELACTPCLGRRVWDEHYHYFLFEMRMELSNAEVATLQEAAVPQQTIRRLQAMMEALDRHQAEDRGPEARWALGCLLRRLDEGLQALDAALGVMARRLVPRGYLPVRRYPVDEGTRWHIYSWARAYRDDLSHILDRHLQTGLIPDDAVFPDSGRPIQAPSSPSVVASEAQASTPREAVSITDDAASPDNDSSDESGEEEATQPSLNSSWARNDTGQLVHVEPASPSDLPRGPPPAVPVNAPVTTADERTGSNQAVSESTGEPTQIERALRGELLGIWREPVTGEIGNTLSSSSSNAVGAVATMGGVVAPLLPGNQEVILGDGVGPDDHDPVPVTVSVNVAEREGTTREFEDPSTTNPEYEAEMATN